MSPLLPRRRGGFTLLEVLLALAVISIAVLALSEAGGRAPRLLADLADRTYAQWIADNAVAEIRLFEGFPEPGPRNGREDMAGRQWLWRAEVSPTADPALRRIDVQVRRDGDETPVLNHTGFAGRW